MNDKTVLIFYMLIPSEILADVFKFLSRNDIEKPCQLVCQRWNFLIQQDSTLPLRLFNQLVLSILGNERIVGKIYYSNQDSTEDSIVASPSIFTVNYGKVIIIEVTKFDPNIKIYDDERLQKIRCLKNSIFDQIHVTYWDDDNTLNFFKNLKNISGCVLKAKTLGIHCEETSFEVGKILIGEYIEAYKVLFSVRLPTGMIYHQNFAHMNFSKTPKKLALNIMGLEFSIGHLLELAKFGKLFNMDYTIVSNSKAIAEQKRDGSQNFCDEWFKVYEKIHDPKYYVRKYKFWVHKKGLFAIEVDNFLSKFDVDSIIKSTPNMTKEGLNCNPRIVTNNSTDLFTQLNINCTFDIRSWWAEDQPSVVTNQSDANYGRCLGYINVPSAVHCSGSFPTTSRICRCDDPSHTPSTFGTGYSNGAITTDEKWIFEHVLAPGDVGVMTHFWITYSTNVDNGVIVRYYIDGEKTPSIQFTPSLACGVGYYDHQGPWGTSWFGKGANDAGWFNNFRIPFQKSIVVTVQHMYQDYGGFYMIVRGSINLPITVGGLPLPKNARMNQFVINGTYQPLEWVPLVNVTSGAGVHWMSTISAGSKNLNFLEGCFHAYFDGNNEFPGVVLSTGTEDYFDSAWYFNAGEFHLPVSGFTHFFQDLTKNYTTWSAYRFHDQDPIFFSDGFQLMWRIGDVYDASGIKCLTEWGNKAGDPGPTDVVAYAWVYTWDTSTNEPSTLASCKPTGPSGDSRGHGMNFYNMIMCLIGLLYIYKL